MISLSFNKTVIQFLDDGTIELSGDTKNKENPLSALHFLMGPKAGKEWWTFMLISQINEQAGLSLGEEAAYKVYPENATRRNNPRNKEFVSWIIEQNLPALASVEAVTNAKSHIWHRDGYPKDSLEAAMVIELLKEGRSWTTIQKAIKQ
jgi:hypothetical protein